MKTLNEISIILSFFFWFFAKVYLLVAVSVGLWIMIKLTRDKNKFRSLIR